MLHLKKVSVRSDLNLNHLSGSSFMKELLTLQLLRYLYNELVIITVHVSICKITILFNFLLSSNVCTLFKQKNKLKL